MGVQVNVKELLTQLYYNRNVIEFLFGNRDGITVTELMNREDITTEQYQRLIDYEILYEYQSIVSVNDAVIAMFEDFMEIGEVTPSFINDYINELKRYIKYFSEGRENRFLRSIKKYLKRINTAITREIIKLQKNVDDTYKNESNFRIKLQKLEDYRSKRDTIIDFIKKTEEIIEETRALFNLTNDLELFSIVTSLKTGLIENLDFLIEIQTDITDYINKIQFQLDVYKKAQQIKEIKDRGELHYKTNFREIVKSINPIGFNNIKAPRTKIPIEFLYTDDGYMLCARVAEKYKITRLMSRRLAEKMTGNFKDVTIENTLKLDTTTLVDKFLSQNKLNLFEFLVSYKFPKAVGNVSFEERITLFVEIVLEYDKSLDFKYRLNYFEYEDNEQKKKRLGYTVIFPKVNSKKKQTK